MQEGRLVQVRDAGSSRTDSDGGVERSRGGFRGLLWG